jgi:hypothetical protein
MKEQQEYGDNCRDTRINNRYIDWTRIFLPLQGFLKIELHSKLHSAEMRTLYPKKGYTNQNIWNNDGYFSGQLRNSSKVVRCLIRSYRGAEIVPEFAASLDTVANRRQEDTA